MDIIVFCGGKCGGSTLTHTFINNRYNSVHLHSFECKGFYESTIDTTNIINIIDNICKNKKIYIIDSYRTPIERKISSFFQNISIHLPDYEKLSVEDLILHFNENYINNLEEYHSIDEILNYYNIPLFKTFNFETRYNIVEKDNKIFIKILFNDIHIWDSILSKIFENKIVIYSFNLTENKDIYNLYNEFKRLYKVPESYIYNILSKDTQFKIYNTKIEQEEYIKKWLNLQEDLNS